MPRFDPTKRALNSPTASVDLRGQLNVLGDKIESPPWHKQVLKEREDRFKSGKESPVDWETAKKRLRNKRP